MGLGWTNHDCLKQVTIDLLIRQMIKATIKDAVLAERMVNVLIGDNANIRKGWMIIILIL